MNLRSRAILVSLTSWLVLPLVSVHGQGPEQEPPFRVNITHLTLEQGLPNRSVTTIGQDKQGFIWIGTLDDAYRFDGNQFSALPPVAKSKEQQPFSQGIDMIRTDRQENLWLTSALVAGYRKEYILKRGQTQPQRLDQAFGPSSTLGNALIYDHIQSPGNAFQYVRSSGGRLWWHRGGRQFRPLFQHPGIQETFRFSLFETAHQTLLATFLTNPSKTTYELIELDSLGHLLQRHSLPFTLRPIWKDAIGNIYLTRFFQYSTLPSRITRPLDAFLYRLSPKGTLTPLPISIHRNPFPDPVHYPFALVHSFYDARHGVFWVFGPKLLLAWHPKLGVVFDLATSGFPLTTIAQFNQVFVDRTGAVWVSTTNGVLLLTLEPNRFRRYLHVADPGSLAPRQAIRGMMQVGTKLWVNGSYCQLVDLKTGQSQFIPQPVDSLRRYTLNLCPVAQTPDGMIWASARDLIRVTPKTLSFQPFLLQSDNISVSNWLDGQLNLWIGHQQGLSIFDTKHQTHHPFTRYNQFPELAKSRINGFFPDPPRHGLWVTASSGLYWLDTLKGITDRYSPLDNGLHHFPFTQPTFIHPDPEQANIYWVATQGSGLIRWDRRRGQYQQFTRQQGLSDNTLYAIYEDRHQRLWLPSNYGLMSFNRKTHQIQIFHAQDGIADEEFNLIAHYRAPDGQLFLGGLNGITAFYPDQISSEKTVEAPLLVTQFRKLDTKTGQMISDLATFEHTHQLHLTPTDRLFTLSFGLLDYRHLNQARLSYRIKGWQDKWVVQDRLELSVNGLPAGDYTVEVRAQTPNADWASPLLTIPVVVDKPIYLRTWFLVLCTLLLMAGILVIFRWRNKQLVQDKARLAAEVKRRTAQIEADKAIIEQQAADLQASVTLRSRFFANVSHELRTPLTLLTGPLQYLSQRITDASTQQLLTAMGRNVQQLITLVNDIMSLSRLDAGQLTVTEQPADLAQLIQDTVGNFRAQAHYNGVHLQTAGLDSPCWLWLDTPKMETVLRNLLANALTYTPTGGTIQVALFQETGFAKIEVSDTGSGIHPADLPHIFERYFQSKQTDRPLRGGTGIGLALSQEYCQLWGGNLTVSSELRKGSTFCVSYPIRRVDVPRPNGTESPAESQPLLPPVKLTPLPPPPNGSITTVEVTLLLIDDNQDMLLYLETILAPYYTLLTAKNGREALSLLQQLTPEQRPSLIISDIMMPEMDGLALVNALRLDETLRNLPIILLTARVDLDSRLQALQLGIADYLTKPFQESELLARIKNLLRRADDQTDWSPEPSEEPLPTAMTNAEWVQWLQKTIRQNLTTPHFNIGRLAELGHTSERQLYRRIRELTGLSPNQLIQEIRLQIAYEIFENNPQALVKSVGYQVGYQKTSYFIQLYRERFGINPGEQYRMANNVDE